MLPITSRAIARTARDAFDAGAGALHLHVRDAEGCHSLDPVRYREAVDAVNEAAPDMTVQITTESGGRYSVGEQAACLREVAPAWASVALREAERDMPQATRLFQDADARGTKVQHILYAPSDIARLIAWQHQGIVGDGRLSVLFVLGSYQGRAAQLTDLTSFIMQPGAEQLDWMVCAFGANERKCLVQALGLGGHVRIGFENNIRHPGGTLLTSNAQSVELLVRSASTQTVQTLEG